jgi:hypothetical protein
MVEVTLFFMPNTRSTSVGFVIGILIAAVIALAYYLNLANQNLTRQGLEIGALAQRVTSVEAAITKSDLNARELRTQISVLRVALQQSTNIRVDASGALITRKSTKSDGIELR